MDESSAFGFGKRRHMAILQSSFDDLVSGCCLNPPCCVCSLPFSQFSPPPSALRTEPRAVGQTLYLGDIYSHSNFKTESHKIAKGALELTP